MRFGIVCRFAFLVPTALTLFPILPRRLIIRLYRNKRAG